MKTKLTIAFAIIAAIAVSASADTFKREMPQVILPMHQLSKPIAFDHLAHRQVECSSCHHKNDDGVESFTPYKCSSCHSTAKQDKSLDNSYFKIIHGKNSLPGDLAIRCLSCHVDEQQTRSHAEPSLIGCATSSCHK